MSRDNWGSRTAFVLAAVGSAAGLGNVWRFPYMAAQNGGGAFLLPYFIALFTAGIPLLIFEFYLGHRYQTGAPTAMQNISEKWEPLGWLSVFVSFAIVCYYPVIMAWVFNYLWHAFSLAWEGDTAGFFFGQILSLSDGPAADFGLKIPILIGLLLTWFFIWWSIRDGVKSVGVVVKVTVTLPIVMLIILAIRGVTLPGAVDGINYYLNPDFSKLTNWKVWADAYGQIFFSLSVAFGVMVAYSSFLPKDSDVTNNAIMTALANCGTSFLGGFAVFGTLGYMAQVQGAYVGDVAGSGGLGMAFVVFPEALATLPFGRVAFALIFFIMLLTLGIDSAFSLVESVSTALADKFAWNRKKTTIGVVAVAGVFSLIFATKSGLYWLDVVDRYVNQFGIIGVAFLEAIMIVTSIKAETIRNYVNEVSEVHLGKWFNYLLGLVTPLILGVILTGNIYNEITDLAAGTLYEGYPMWVIAVGGYGVLAALVIASFIFGLKKTAVNVEE
ncbi:sodium-dependent transporter [Gottschalkiaceae bacterium SANA]|nr:sodium-dependent transporter [Gottschalkiaceae bacterium SANA]